MLKAVCKHSHPLSGDNLYVAPKSGIRGCRICRYDASKRARTPALAKASQDHRYFDSKRELVIKRDGEKCVKCGMARTEHKAKFGKDITVDHIDGVGRYSKIPNNDLSNLQTLCITCHGLKDGVRSSYLHSVTLAPEDIQDIRMFAKSGMTSRQILKGYQMLTRQTIKNIVARRSWNWA